MVSGGHQYRVCLKSIAATAICFLCAYPAKPQQSNTWPPNALPNGSLSIGADDIPAYIPDLYLPDGFKLRIAGDNTDHISIAVGKLTFGIAAEIDLQALPSRAADGAPGIDNSNAPQATYCQKGASGTRGQDGAPGKPGLSLTMNIGSLTPQGSLWICTSGQPGGNGGKGGGGGLGGGMKTNWIDHCPGGDGGDAGAGGNGGKGGAVSNVQLIVGGQNGFTISQASVRRSPVGGPYGPVSRPPNSLGNDGQIFIYGAPGKGGLPGDPGVPGGGGDQGQSYWYAIGGVNINGGNPGRAAPAGRPGADGDVPPGARIIGHSGHHHIKAP